MSMTEPEKKVGLVSEPEGLEVPAESDARSVEDDAVPAESTALPAEDDDAVPAESVALPAEDDAVPGRSQVVTAGSGAAPSETGAEAPGTGATTADSQVEPGPEHDVVDTRVPLEPAAGDWSPWSTPVADGPDEQRSQRIAAATDWRDDAGVPDRSSPTETADEAAADVEPADTVTADVALADPAERTPEAPLAPVDADGETSTAQVAPVDADGETSAAQVAPVDADGETSAAQVAPVDADGETSAAQVTPVDVDDRFPTDGTDPSPLPAEDDVATVEVSDTGLSESERVELSEDVESPPGEWGGPHDTMTSDQVVLEPDGDDESTPAREVEDESDGQYPPAVRAESGMAATFEPEPIDEPAAAAAPGDVVADGSLGEQADVVSDAASSADSTTGRDTGVDVSAEPVEPVDDVDDDLRSSDRLDSAAEVPVDSMTGDDPTALDDTVGVADAADEPG
ncbi:MAG: hypothetical protein ACRCY8_11045, partial [Dermatophilaceae bacterium]